jgi:WD40 repeat protein
MVDKLRRPNGNRIRAIIGNGSTFSSDEDRILSFVSANRSDLFDFSSAEECRRLHFNAPAGGSYQLVYDPNGQFLISTHKDGLRFWNTKFPGQSAFMPDAEIRSVEFARDGHGFIPSAVASSQLRWWQANGTIPCRW